MTLDIKPIPLGFVNAYLIKADSGFFLVDTGMATQRAAMERALADAGCRPGDLRVILVTHGDSDHIGNCAYLREKYGAKIAMHPNEAGLAAGGTMLVSRKPQQSLGTWLFMGVLGRFFALSKSNRFKADLSLADGDDLSAWGLQATALHIPGHSTGSMGILTPAGDLFCGDLMSNNRRPQLHIVDDLAAARASVERLRRLGVKTVYPGHGKPFAMEALVLSKSTFCLG